MASPEAVAEGAPGRERIVELQRARILAAIVELVGERGVSGVTVSHITGRSRVSRRTFYELFADRDDCLAAAFEDALARAVAVVVPAYERADGVAAAGGSGRARANGDDACPVDAWEARVRAGLAALLAFLDAQPALGRLLVVDALAADRRVLASRARAIEMLVDAVHLGGEGPAGPRPRPARIVAEGAVGAVASVIHARVCGPQPEPLAPLLGPLTAMIVLPYRGAEAAERERRRRAPARSRGPAREPSPVADPLRALDMRLTYRTIRVLQAISELDGGAAPPSSREVADAAGVTDQGQISKLLWRLERLGLIVNCAKQPARGAPNAWSLTARGREIERAIRVQVGA